MTKDKAKEVDDLIKAAFDLPAPEMPDLFGEVIELTDEDMEYLAAAKHNSMAVGTKPLGGI